MKIYSEVSLLVGLTFLSLLADVPSKDDIRLAIVSGHTSAFGKDNLITQPLSIDDIKPWNDVIKGIESFITAKKDKIKDKKKRDQYPQLVSEIKAISDTFIAHLAQNYQNNIMPTIKTNKDKGFIINKDMIKILEGTINIDAPIGQELSQEIKNTYDNLNIELLMKKNDILGTQFIKKILEQLDTLQKIQKTIETNPKKTKTTEEEDIIEILKNLLLFLDTTLQKVLQDFTNLKVFTTNAPQFISQLKKPDKPEIGFPSLVKSFQDLESSFHKLSDKLHPTA